MITKTLYVPSWDNEEHKKAVKDLMKKINIAISNEEKFESKQDEYIDIAYSDSEITELLEDMSRCDYIMLHE